MKKMLFIICCIFLLSNKIISENSRSSLKFLNDDLGNINTTKNVHLADKLQKIIPALESLFKEIQKTQSQSDVSFRNFPPRYSEIKGLYSSFIHLNFIDKQNSLISDIFRDKFSALDMNMFVTNFIVCSLLEAIPFNSEFLNNKENLSNFKNSLTIALEGLSQFKDKNYNDTIPVYNFWKQDLLNGTWTQTPDTMLHLIKIAPHFPKILINFLEKIHLENVAQFLETFEKMSQIFLYAFRIPPDADDSSVNMALTGLLHKMENDWLLNDFVSNNENKKEVNENNSFLNLFKNMIKDIVSKLNLKKSPNKEHKDSNKILNETLKNWYTNNTNYDLFFEKLKSKAYRPFLNHNFTEKNFKEISETADVIDPRTYFVVRKFLQEKFNEKKDLILPTTWVHDFADEVKEFPLVTMPFRVNNLDFNVVTNFLYGITNLVLHHPDKEYIKKIFDEEMQKMYSDSIDLIIYGIKEDIFNWRPDLALLYYPSVFDFYWLISRVYSSLKNSQDEIDSFIGFDDNIHETLDRSKYFLQLLLKKYMTTTMQKKILKNEKNPIEFYFVEFLGNTENSKKNEDSMFATSLGLNAFLNIWTKEVKENNLKKIVFDEYTPDEVKNIIHNLAEYLLNNVNKKNTSFEGAFFSGSVKSESSNAYYFPANNYKFLNGTDLIDHSDPMAFSLNFSLGVKGYVNEENYQIMLKDIYFGKKTPVDFTDYSLDIFPYWSSSAMTMSVNFLALSKYSSLVE